MTPIKALQRAGEALFGAQWQSEIGRALGVSDRTVRRWLTGEHNMPDDIKPRLRALIAARIAVLRKVRSDLR